MPDIGRSKQLWKLNGGWMRGYSALPGAASVSREGATDPPPPSLLLGLAVSGGCGRLRDELHESYSVIYKRGHDD